MGSGPGRKSGGYEFESQPGHKTFSENIHEIVPTAIFFSSS